MVLPFSPPRLFLFGAGVGIAVGVKTVMQSNPGPNNAFLLLHLQAGWYQIPLHGGLPEKKPSVCLRNFLT
jgi:hypothetical protein